MKIRHESERRFMRYVTDGNKEYFHHPRWFPLSNGSKYMPDFYCKQDDTYIEVVGGSSTYESNMSKYEMMGNEYPLIKLIFIWIWAEGDVVKYEERPFVPEPKKQGNHKPRECTCGKCGKTWWSKARTDMPVSCYYCKCRTWSTYKDRS